ERVLFADDHLLARVSPNPLIELGPAGEADKFRALVSYFASIRKVRALPLEWILPGHGAPFRGHEEVIDSLLAFYEKRQGRLLAALAGGAKTPYELVTALFGGARTLALYLMLSEVVGNLEVLEDAGRVRRVPDEVPYRYASAEG
ncbi:MAG: MBL fold metallo-hydrolase, partial [Myxococcales bacterium]